MKVVMKGNTGKGKHRIKDYHKGTVAKNSHDVASKDVHKKYGTMGKGRNLGLKKDPS